MEGDKQNIRKVIMTYRGVRHFDSYGTCKVTEGKIYDYPNLIDDDGKLLELNPNEKYWSKEFIFISGNQETTNTPSNIITKTKKGGGGKEKGI